MTTRWLDPAPVEIPASFGILNLPPLIAGTLVRRGITNPSDAQAFLDPSAQPESSPYELPGMDAAVERILLAIRNNESICIWGDFDVDGQTSTALLVQTLTALGADVTYHIPIRAVSSHGVHIPELTEIIDRGAKLILTCDTGITAHEAVELRQIPRRGFRHHRSPRSRSSSSGGRAIAKSVVEMSSTCQMPSR